MLENLFLLTDLYELTMMQGYFYKHKNINVVFDMFFRKFPFKGGYAIFAGLETLLKALKNIKVTEKEIEYLKSLNTFKDEFLEYLKDFKFSGDIYSVREGTVVFPNEPLIRVEANIIEAQLIESMLLNIINYETLIATKTARIVESSKNGKILEFGLRRAHGPYGAILATRASYIGGAIATSNTMAGEMFGIPVSGTMAHSWIMSFPTELEAFEAYAEMYPDNCILLVDTYDTLESGIPNAIKVLKKLKKKGKKNFGIRLDSGDLEFLSKEARKMFDKNNLKEAKIFVSNELDEFIIEQLINNGSPIDAWGVGTNLVTAKGDPSLSGVYKISAKKIKNKYIPTIKISNNIGKTTNPGRKNVLRFYDKDGFMIDDIIFLDCKNITDNVLKKVKKQMLIKCYHPYLEHEFVELSNYEKTEILLQKVFENGTPLIKFDNLKKVQENTLENLKKLHYTYKRLINPHIYKVSLSEDLKKLKFKMIEEIKGK